MTINRLSLKMHNKNGICEYFTHKPAHNKSTDAKATLRLHFPHCI